MSTLKRFLCIMLCFLFISIGNEIIYSKVTNVNTVKGAADAKAGTPVKGIATTTKANNTTKSNTTAKTNTTKKAVAKVYADLNKITFDKNVNKLDVELTAKPSKVKCFYLGEDNKVVLDLYDCKNKVKNNQIDGNNKNILDIRNAQFSNNPSIARVVVDLNKKIEYKVTSSGKKITLVFTDNDESSQDANTNHTDVIPTPSPSPSQSPKPSQSPTPNPSPSSKPSPSPANSNQNNSNGDNGKTVDNTDNSKNKVTYIRTAKSIIHISNMKALKYNLEDKTVSFQLDNSYDLSALEDVSDDYISGIEIISATTFNTVIITMKDSYQPMIESSGDGVDFVLSNPVPQPTQSPVNNKQRTVVIDPGHGGTESGAVEAGKKDGDPTKLLEKNLNLDISLRVKTLLEAQNIKVYMTRTKDEYLNKSAKTVTEELTARAQYASTLKADFFVSIHSNSATPAASGAETLYYPTDGPYKKTLKKGKLNSIDFAQIVQSELIKATGATDRKTVARPNLVVLKYNQVVPILVEVGFISNAKELAKLKTDAYKQKIAQGICNGIMKAYSKN
jgi:N-acetylmuramoyl-L-alanine amidase